MHLFIKIVSRILKEKWETETEIPHLLTPTPLGVEEETSHGESLYLDEREGIVVIHGNRHQISKNVSKSPIKKQKFLLHNNSNPSQENLQLLRTQYSNVSR